MHDLAARLLERFERQEVSGDGEAGFLGELAARCG
jgi:hypothetical protein